MFERAGYGEVYTPALEYEQTFAARGCAATRPAYRVFDEQGNVLVLRSDMTVPIARLAATRYAHADPPLRFCYSPTLTGASGPSAASRASSSRPGVELIGVPGARGHR